jgi:hypothetical protein
MMMIRQKDLVLNKEDVAYERDPKVRFFGETCKDSAKWCEVSSIQLGM